MARDRQEAARAREEQARILAEQPAGEQARMLAEQAGKQARHLVEVVQASLSSLRTETQHYTGQACESLNSEVLSEVQSLRTEVDGLKEEVQYQKREADVATWKD